LGGIIKKILITGASGYIGLRLSNYFARKGYSVTALCRSKPKENDIWAKNMKEIIIGDITKEDTLDRIGDVKFYAIIHLVSLDQKKSNGDIDHVTSVNVKPTWKLLDKYTKLGLEKFIYLSTIHVYGHIPPKIINENQRPEPNTAYGLTHLLSENICNYFNAISNTHCIIARLSNSYGSPLINENNCWWLVINDLCKTIYEQKKIKLKSDGSPQRDFVHGDDVVRAINFLVEKAKNSNENIYHIASGKTLTILELASMIKQLYFDRYNNNANIFLQNDSMLTNSGQTKKIDKYKISISRLNNLGYTPKTSIRDGINELFNYLEN